MRRSSPGYRNLLPPAAYAKVSGPEEEREADDRMESAAIVAEDKGAYPVSYTHLAVRPAGDAVSGEAQATESVIDHGDVEDKLSLIHLLSECE